MVDHSPAASHSIELGALLHDFHLSLVLIAGADAEAAARPVQWVHSSELEDPTPFLTPRTVLLTTAARFSAESAQEEADAYVQRLIDSGATALGIAVGLHWDRVPLIFIRACDRLGLPLIRVPYRTSFISIVQTTARLLDLKTHARDSWLLESQRIVTNASLHRNGLGSAVREAATRLDRWVAITDRTGRVTEFAPRSARGEISAELLRRETRRIVEGGVRAGRIEHSAGNGMQLRALGRRGQVLGVLIVEDAGKPDRAERTLIGLLEALATVQLEHRTGVGEAESTLRIAIVELLLAGHLDLAERVSARVITRIPRDPVVVFRFIDPQHSGFSDDLQSLDAASPGFLRAPLGSEPILITEARHVAAVRRLLETHSVTAGHSERSSLEHLTRLMDQASLALQRAEEGSTIAYRPDLHAGVFDLIREDRAARWRATELLSPLRAHDARYGERLEESLRVWLSHHGQTSPAADELGVHRHTLRSRVHAAARLLHINLDSADGRAELWTALRLAES